MSSRDNDLNRARHPAVPGTQSGTTSDRDFGKTDRYANKDDEQDFNVRMTGDGTSWDTGRESSAGHGSGGDTKPRAADASTPGVNTEPATPDGTRTKEPDTTG